MENTFMKMAIDLARSTHGQTSPNPVVGAIIVRNNQIVGMGAHLKAGEPHAERHALQMAGEKAKNATMYVTLEPCSHFGKTPPCADAVIEAGIKKVYIASTDPNPKVAGNGIDRLRQAGIDVEVDIMKEEADRLNQVFFHYIQTGKPFVTLKSATSLDGKIATSKGESQWITCEESRYDSHQLRHINDAILVGVNTILADNPSLTTRLNEGGKNPIRIVLDHKLRTPETAKVVTDQLAPTWIFTTNHTNAQKIQKLEDAGVKVIVLNSKKIIISDLLTYLGENQISSLLVEGGSTINDAFLQNGDFQQVIVYLAPLIIGGKDALTSFSGKGILHLKDATMLKINSVERTGNDVKLVLTKGE
ncbi:bifunctional diaminohydroxyphosphoribosylaminopyrimidine deaminase/5-amino-6-(5-phosphoribosylamino)uracil reductase RibD [Evansella sp. AB-P1]|uniref:bifunctional diaminohydroxyphosphoribosylaminopyrimidine deaminase/5-amino-6-(5-phosphoribosylamino)uracil reductase RibD n=1 Tax=Evansella sp. AB-P1 TaxID=3037653 RepID=UPI00241F3543|nr:bifunctional diaminohydroxyphosphoribosylaminopyrimidine deaminase/5-amino-6-(5-phosphoribosylamino)uracil reductase RibD [Evansella sp. AB-P1]MDG5787668.1 bifunctional diaminohydroxyphosphoribosylaminopyrimidine deaminase/5-amino-6-(5-phosphoribosylamino)uracil reductase RibD [Evansella sp. AB-P1]